MQRLKSGPGAVNDQNLSCREIGKRVNKAMLIQKGHRTEENFPLAKIPYKLWWQSTSSKFAVLNIVFFFF